MVAWPIRWGGLGLIVLGALLALGARYGTLGLDNGVMPFAYGALALGWAMVLAAIYIRTQHHKRRLREEAVMTTEQDTAADPANSSIMFAGIARHRDLARGWRSP